MYVHYKCLLTVWMSSHSYVHFLSANCLNDPYVYPLSLTLPVIVRLLTVVSAYYLLTLV